MDELLTGVGECDLVSLVGVDPNDGTPPSEDARALFRSRLGLEQTHYTVDALGHHIVVLDSVSINEDGTDYLGFVGPSTKPRVW